MRKPISQKHPDREILRAAKRLVRREVFYTGVIGAVIGAEIGYRKGVRDIRAVEKISGQAGSLAASWSTLSEDIYGRSPFKETCEKVAGGESKECEQAFAKSIKSLGEIVGRMEAERVENARQALTTKTVIGALGGGVSGAVLAVGVFVALMKIHIRREERRMTESRRARMEADRERRRAEGMEERGSEEIGPDAVTLRLKIVREDKEEDPEAKERKRVGREADIERAIRGVCGRKVSREVAYALATVLSYRQTQLLVEEPDNLRKVLAEHKDEIDVELRKYGLGVDAVLEEMKKREQNPEKQDDPAVRAR